MELMVFLPGMLLAYFPVKQYLRLRPAKLAAVAVPLILFLCLAGEAVCRFSHINILWLFFPAAAIMGSFYVHTLQVTRWKSVSVFLAVCGVFSCMLGASVAVSDTISPGKPAMTCAIILTSCPDSPSRRNGKAL